MAWRDVFITNPCRISYTNNNIIVQTSEGANYLNLNDLQSLIIDTPEAVITSRALSEIAKNQISFMMADENFLPSITLSSPIGSTFSVKKINSQINWSEDRKNTLWTKIIYRKISNQINTAQELKCNVIGMQKHLDKLEYGDKTNQEAIVANLYFSLIAGKGFKRREESFPINNCLDYGYAVLLNRISMEIAGHGFLLQLGIHHCSVANPYNLSSDLIEPWRFIMDDYVFKNDITDLNTLNKARLIDRLNYEIKFNGKRQLVSNAIKIYVNDCLNYLNEKKDDISFEVEKIEDSDNENASDV